MSVLYGREGAGLVVFVRAPTSRCDILLRHPAATSHCCFAAYRPPITNAYSCLPAPQIDILEPKEDVAPKAPRSEHKGAKKEDPAAMAPPGEVPV